MSRLDNLPEQNGSGLSSEQTHTAESLLRSMVQDLKTLQQGVLSELNQDITRLQAEKSRLLNDIEKLQSQQQSLQSQNSIELSQQQLAQQQAWAKQLALVLANHLQTALNERLNQTLGAHSAGADRAGNLQQIPAAGSESYRLAASLDETVNRTFASLRHDINSYQSSLGQQLERMHTLGQQGEAILEVLVKRLSQQLQTEARSQGNGRPSLDTLFPPREISPSHEISPSREISPSSSLTPHPQFPLAPAQPPVPAPPPVPSSSANPFSWSDSLFSVTDSPAAAGSMNNTIPEPELDPEETVRSERPRRSVSVRTGLGFALLSALAISLHYVVVGIIGNSSQLFGQQAIGGYLTLNTFSNASLLLLIRLSVVIPLMVWLSTYLHPSTLREVRAFSRSTDRRAFWGVIGSGVFLFLSQVLLYAAIGQAGSGVAVALWFTYPIGTVLCGLLLFGERFTFNRFAVALAILLGASLSIYPLLGQTAAMGGIAAGLMAVVAFTFYLTAMQIGVRKIHPVPVSLIQFAVMFVLSSLSLMVFGINAQPNWTPLLISGGILGVLTLGSYWFNHLGIRAIGTTRSAIIAASTPVLTALLAFFLVPGGLTTLKPIQMVGILMVTLGGTALSLERLMQQNRAARQARRQEELQEAE